MQHELPSTPSARLDGRRALVAGGSSGIGLGCAMALAEAGAHVTICARRPPELGDAVDAIRSRGFDAAPLQLDIADVEATERAVATEGPFDVLVNSAGSARHGPALTTTPADFDAVMSINLRGAYFLCRAVAAGLINAGKRGSIINMSSQMGHVGGIERAVYCASKHAMEGFTKAMAVEWATRGIRVNTICPTFVRTPLAAQTLDDAEKRRWVEANIPLGRIGETEDIMGAVLFLASDLSAMVTGSALRVDGGWTAA
ncbi:SDR family NAD(P)-dependent oxidoreductase [Devosia algicola]|uniref:SDR family NAD(P)-dependent oxidoreductase n=1 Tax=Devosia algicola TaxID=3026418 RepID=A0ABY7YRD8_9HYPH|nr:SDR family oxidoreductase [Devosia algicola]WDR03890.1 SDR family NAD(P)-dependent oxidoreductase [Devosia algicola]